MSLAPACTGFEKRRCAFNPLVKCNTCASRAEGVIYASRAAMIMLYYKVKDNLADAGIFQKIPAALSYPLFALARRKAAKLDGELDAVMAEAITAQTQLETEGCQSLDAAAEPTSRALSRVFSRGIENPKQARVLERLGYCLGKWIYLVDALDDLEEDIQKKGYNPIASHFELNADSSVDYVEECKANTLQTLNVCICEAAAAFELLECHRFREVLENILYQGLPDVQEKIMKKGKKE